MMNKKILAAIAVLAMAFCVFAAVAPADLDAEVASGSDASIDDVGYATLKAALDAAEEGDTVVLLDDVIAEETIAIPAGVTLALGENKLSIGGNGILNMMGSITVGDEVDVFANLTIRENGQINVYGKAVVADYEATDYFGENVAENVRVMVITDEDTEPGFNITLEKNANVPTVFAVPEGYFLKIESGVTLDLSGITGGALVNGGTIYNAGSIIDGTITNNGTYYNVVSAFTNGNGLAGVNVANDVVVTTGTFGEWISADQYWRFKTTETKTLTLNNYNGTGTFNYEGDYTVDVKGTNVIDRSSIDNTSDATTTPRVVLGEASAFESTVLTISGNGSLAIKTEKHKEALGIAAKAVSISGTSSSAKVTLDVTAYNKAIYSQNNLTIGNAIIDATAGEKALRAVGTLSLTTGADATAKLGSGSVNSGDLNDITGTKTSILTIASGASLTTDGIFITDDSGAKTSSIAGKLVVTHSDLNVGYSTNNVNSIPGGFIAMSNDAETIREITISAGANITVAQGAGIIAKINYDEGEYVQLGMVNIQITGTSGQTDAGIPAIAASDVGISYGSVVVEGAITKEYDDTTGNLVWITINGDAELSGTIDVPVTVNAGSVVTVPAGKTLTLNSTMTVANNASAKVNILGDIDGNGEISAGANAKVTASNPIVAQTMVTGATVTTSTVVGKFIPSTNSDAETRLAQDENAFKSLLLSKNIIVMDVTPAGSPFSVEYTFGFDVTIPAGVTLYLNGCTLTIANGTNFAVNGGKIRTGLPADLAGVTVTNSNSTYTGGIIVTGSLLLDAADVCAPVTITDDDVNKVYGYVSIVNPLVSKIESSVPDSLNVGYGNTVILTDAAIPAGMVVDIYGTLELKGKVSVAYGSVLNIAKSGEVDVIGQFDVAGTMTNLGAVVVDGTMNVSSDNGGSTLNTSGLVEVNGTFNVTKPKVSNASKVNALTINGTTSKTVGFYVYGTMNITGDVKGEIQDLGTIILNGKSVDDGLRIVVYDGITLTVQSIVNEVTITDLGICAGSVEGLKNYATSTGNTVVLDDVEGVTVSVAVTSKTVTDADDIKYRYEIADMTVTGTVTSVYKEGEGSVAVTGADISTAVKDVSGTATTTTWDSKTSKGGITVIDMTLGERISLGFMDNNMVADGTINAIAKFSKIETSAYATVTGTVTIGPDANLYPGTAADTYIQTLPVKFNAATYQITDLTDGESTVYYTTIEDAVAKIATADDKTVDILGEIIVNGEIIIPAGSKVAMDPESEIVIEGDITVEADALFDAGQAKVEVEGTLVINNKSTGFVFNTATGMFVYQVYTENGDVATYTGIIGALENAKSGDVITLKQSAIVDENLVIPEGVTLVVPAKVTLTFDAAKNDVKLTVNGTLKVEKKGFVLAANNSTNEATMVINGVYANAEPEGEYNYLNMDNYVKFEKKVDGVLTVFRSNLTFAATECINGTITAYGEVSAGDIVLTEGDKGDDLVLVIPADAVVTADSITLVDAKIQISKKDPSVTEQKNGILSSNVVVGATAGKILVELNKVSGITVEAITEAEADGDVTTMTISGNLVGGITVSEGTVEVSKDGLTVGTTKDDILSVAEGATIVVGKNAGITVAPIAPTASVEFYFGLDVAGTLSIIDGGELDVASDVYNEELGIVMISGTMDLVEGTVTVDGLMIVNGTAKVNDAEDVDAVLNVKGAMFVNVPVDVLGATVASVTGEVKIGTDGLVIEFVGADLTGAILDADASGKATAVSTTYYVNGAEYMTAHVDANTNWNNGHVRAFVDIDGFQPVLAWYAAENFKSTDNDVNSDMIGDHEKVYGEAKPALVRGTISQGNGITLYIDGKTIDNFNYGYTATQEKVYALSVGKHVVTYDIMSGYNGSDVVVTFNGVVITQGGTIEVTSDMEEFSLLSTGAVPAPSVVVPSEDTEDGMALTEILLIVLVVLILIMAIIVAMRLMRN